MQTFQTRQVLAIIKATFFRKDSVFNVMLVVWQNKTDPQFAGLFCCCAEQSAS